MKNLQQQLKFWNLLQMKILMQHGRVSPRRTCMFQMPKKVALRSFAYNHIYHHRGQLSVYLRLLNIPVPGMYGPSADETM